MPRLLVFCRDDWIRTSDPFVPNEVRYRAALHPERVSKNKKNLEKSRARSKTTKPCLSSRLLLFVGTTRLAPLIYKGELNSKSLLALLDRALSFFCICKLACMLQNEKALTFAKAFAVRRDD
jgi:hypothetical protein